MNDRRRSLLVLGLLALGFTVVSLRLVWIQLFEHERYVEEAIQNHWDKKIVPARRGSILDAAGNMVAQTHILYDVRLDARAVTPKDLPQLGQLAAILGTPWAEFRAKYEPNNRYLLLKRDVTEEVAVALRDLKFKPLITEEKQVRSYPNRWQAAHMVGFLDQNGRGVLGVEKAVNELLSGLPGERWIEKDARRREIVAYRRKDTPPIDGSQVTLTIDMEIQHIVEDEADRLVRDFSPHGVFIVAMRPKTGEILALANRPTFDPNAREGVTMAAMRNRCVTDFYEPGSIFKIVTLAATLNERIANLNTPIFCENGHFYYGGSWLKDHEPQGTIPILKGFQVSSNIMMAKLGLALGNDRLYQYAHNFGFGVPTGILPGQSESGGMLSPVRNWSKISATRIPMGQEVGATPLQMIAALSAIANGGTLMAPQFIKQVADDHGRVFKVFRPRIVRQVVSRDTARQVSKALAAVVSSEGTGKNADVPGYTVAGKTGTAQKAENGHYTLDKHVASFMGYLPEEDPQFSLLVMVDEPQGKKYYAADVAAPAFANIAKQMAQSLDLVPNQPVEHKTQEARL
jgi:cell division protein FtsI (penicillin-binding protein 3)/stage V sporulation protein D (sporulation-specific penicillin-binding protein)